MHRQSLVRLDMVDGIGTCSGDLICVNIPVMSPRYGQNCSKEADLRVGGDYSMFALHLLTPKYVAAMT